MQNAAAGMRSQLSLLTRSDNSQQLSRLYEKRQRSLSIGQLPTTFEANNDHYQSFVRAVARWRCDVFDGGGDRNSTILMQLLHLMVQKS